MPSVKFPGDDQVHPLPRTMTVLEAALHCNFPLQHVCGGHGRCATCEVKVVSGEVSEPVKREGELLFDRVEKHNQRLGCMCKILGDVEVAVPEYTTSIDAIYDDMPGVVVSRGRFYNYRKHLQHEAERDIESPFYIFRKRYSTTQAMRNQREEKHRLAQAREFGRQNRPQEGRAGGGEERDGRPRRRGGRRRDRNRRSPQGQGQGGPSSQPSGQSPQSGSGPAQQ